MLNKIKVTKSLSRGQSMVEFSMVLPILMVVIFGLLEVGRAVFMYAAVTNASREAVRYATAYGVNESDVLHYQNCAAIGMRPGGWLSLYRWQTMILRSDTIQVLMLLPDGIW